MDVVLEHGQWCYDKCLYETNKQDIKQRCRDWIDEQYKSEPITRELLHAIINGWR